MNHKLPFPRMAGLHRVPLAGGPLVPVEWGPALAIAYGPDGGVVLGRKTPDMGSKGALSPTAQRYRGGTAGELWIDPAASPRTERRTTATSPCPCGSGTGSTFCPTARASATCTLSGRTGRTLPGTDHADYHARNARTGGRRIAYPAGGDLYLYDPAARRTRQIPVDLKSPRTGRARRFVDAGRFLTEYAPHPTSERLLVVSRGELFDLPPFEGPVMGVAAESGVRARLPRWLTADRVVHCDDAGGEDRIVVAPAHGGTPEVLWADDIGALTGLEANRPGTYVAYTNHRMELWLLQVATRRATRVEQNGFGDGDPAWDPAGRYLYVLGARVLDPVYDQITFDLGFPRARHPYLLTLTADEPPPFLGAPPRATARRSGSISTAWKTDWCRSRWRRGSTVRSWRSPTRCCGACLNPRAPCPGRGPRAEGAAGRSWRTTSPPGNALRGPQTWTAPASPSPRSPFGSRTWAGV